MPRVEVVDSPVGANKQVEVAGEEELADIADEARLPIPFSCRSATCGTCHVLVLEGSEHLEPPGEEELELLDIVGGPDGSRFACQVRIRPGPGVVRLRPL